MVISLINSLLVLELRHDEIIPVGSLRPMGIPTHSHEKSHINLLDHVIY